MFRYLDNTFLSSKILKSSLKISFSKISSHISKRDTGWLFDICLSFFLWIGAIFALFHWVVNVPAAREFWKWMSDRVSTKLNHPSRDIIMTMYLIYTITFIIVITPWIHFRLLSECVPLSRKSYIYMLHTFTIKSYT